jgi:hypothetical protein
VGNFAPSCRHGFKGVCGEVRWSLLQEAPLQNTGQDCLLCVPNYQDWPLASDGREITDMKG